MTPGVDLRGVRDRIAAAVDAATNDSSAGGVVIVDQFEETFGRDPDEVEALHDLLSNLARRPDCDVVIGLRDDFFDEASKHEWLRDGLRHRAEIVSAPSIDRLPELIVEPAKQAGLDIEPGLVADTWAPVGESSFPSIVTHIAFVGDRDAMVTVAGGSLRSLDLSEPAFQPLGATIWSVSYSPDGQLVAASSREKTLVWEPEGAALGEPTSTILPIGDDVLTGTNAISPDGRWVSLGTSAGAVVVADLDDLEGAADGSSLRVLPDLPLAIDELTDSTDNQALVENMSFSHDSSILAAVGGEGFAQLWTVSASEDFEPSARFQSTVWRATWCSTGRVR